MTTNLTRPVLLAGCLLVLSYVGFDTAYAQSTRTRLAAGGQYTEGGNELCLSCHGGEAMTIMAETPHGNLDNPHTPYSQQGCESCHGPGSVHVSRAGGGIGFPLLRSFNDTADVPEQNAACMECHAKALGGLGTLPWAGSPHDEVGMSCQNCHDSHSTEDPMADQSGQLKLCADCHLDQIEVHREAELPVDTYSCSECHEVHFDAANAQSTQAQYTDGGTEFCLSCHGGETMTIMAETPHGNLDNPHTPYSQQGCESCHGPGSVHVSRAGGGIGFPLLLSFKNKVRFAVPKENAACMNCHSKAMSGLGALPWTGSPHDDVGMSCQDCHDSHTTEDPMADPRQNAACMKCHAEAQGRLDALTWTGSPHADIGMSCQDCHDVHSTKDPMAHQDVQLEHCANCHLDEIEMHRDVELPVDTYSCSECHEVHEP